MSWVNVAVAGFAAVGSYRQSSNNKAQADYQAKVARNNQQLAEWQALDALRRGDTEAANVRRRYAALEGTQVASLAARGLDISEGSANAILADTSYFGDLDQRTVRANAAREAWGYRTRASGFAGDAAAFKAGADAINPAVSGLLAGTAAYFGSGGKTALTSSTSVNSRWYGSGTTYSGDPYIGNVG